MGGGRRLEQDRKRMDVRVVKGGQSAEYRMYLRMVSYLVLFQGMRFVFVLGCALPGARV